MRRLFSIICFTIFSLVLYAQEEVQVVPDSLLQKATEFQVLPTAIDPMDSAQVVYIDSLGMPVDTAAIGAVTDSIMSVIEEEVLDKRAHWKPDPIRAMWLGLVLPGAGQIYNRKYWKLPIIYGGIIGCLYALTWNGQMLRDYNQAYLDIMDADPNTRSYEKMLPMGFDIRGKEEMYKSIFQRKKNTYRRWRDLSIFVMLAVYAISVVDAYIDAELSTFDISPNLSMHIAPTTITSKTLDHKRIDVSPALGVQLNF